MDLREHCKRTTYKRIQRGKKAGFFKFGGLQERSILLKNKNDKKKKKHIVSFFFSLSHLYQTEEAQYPSFFLYISQLQRVLLKMEGTINWQSQVFTTVFVFILGDGHYRRADNFSLQSLIMSFTDMKYRGGFLILPLLVRVF